MVVIALILLSLAVALFIMLSDTRRNDNFQWLEREAGRREPPADPVVDPALDPTVGAWAERPPGPRDGG
ncbi:MAG: hypothetical protein KGQ52_04395 [Alphaproteobacteria bacterium]|nr:hypothetical protein [Alphaproteobacteria bacterium]